MFSSRISFLSSHNSMRGQHFRLQNTEADYVEITAMGDGNCGPYAFALGLVDLIQHDELQLADETFKDFLQHIKATLNVATAWLTSPYCAYEDMGAEVRSLCAEMQKIKTFEEFVALVKKQRSRKELAALQIILGPAIRRKAVYLDKMSKFSAGFIDADGAPLIDDDAIAERQDYANMSAQSLENFAYHFLQINLNVYRRADQDGMLQVNIPGYNPPTVNGRPSIAILHYGNHFNYLMPAGRRTGLANLPASTATPSFDVSGPTFSEQPKPADFTTPISYATAPTYVAPRVESVIQGPQQPATVTRVPEPVRPVTPITAPQSSPQQPTTVTRVPEPARPVTPTTAPVSSYAACPAYNAQQPVIVPSAQPVIQRPQAQQQANPFIPQPTKALVNLDKETHSVLNEAISKEKLSQISGQCINVSESLLNQPGMADRIVIANQSDVIVRNMRTKLNVSAASLANVSLHRYEKDILLKAGSFQPLSSDGNTDLALARSLQNAEVLAFLNRNYQVLTTGTAKPIKPAKASQAKNLSHPSPSYVKSGRSQ